MAMAATCDTNILSDDVYDALNSPVMGEYGQLPEDHRRQKKKWRMSVDGTPLKKFLHMGEENHLPSVANFLSNCHLPHHDQDLILPAKCKKALQDFCSPPRKRDSKKKKNSRQRFSLGGRCCDLPSNIVGDENNAASSREEDVAQVYENVEILLDALRTERHQEKLVKDLEISKLQEKIAELEKQKEQSLMEEQDSTCAKEDQDEDKITGDVDGEITETLLETLALLEDECEEWQATSKGKRKSMDKKSKGDKRRKSLEYSPAPMVTYEEKEAVLPSPEESEEPSTPSAEQRIIESVNRLKDMEFLPDEDRKLLTWYLTDETKSGTNGYKYARAVASLRKKSKELEQEVLHKDLEMSKERAALRQEIFKKDLELRELQKLLISTNKDGNTDDGNAMSKEGLVCMQEEIQPELDQKQKEDSNEVEEEKDTDQNPAEDREQKMESAKEKNLEEKMGRQMKELEQKLNKVQCEFSGSQRKHSDVLMKLAVESTTKASLSMKLDSALAQIEKQKQAISFLNQELGQAKYDCKLLKEQVLELSEI